MHDAPAGQTGVLVVNAPWSSGPAMDLKTATVDALVPDAGQERIVAVVVDARFTKHRRSGDQERDAEPRCGPGDDSPSVHGAGAATSRASSPPRLWRYCIRRRRISS